MKKKLLLSVILFVGLFVSVYSFTGTSKAVELSDSHLNLDATQQKEILTAYDIDHNGKINAKDVALMRRNIAQYGERTYTTAESKNLQWLCVLELKFTWCTGEATSMKKFNEWISMGKLLYIDYFPNGSNKIIAHINIHGRFVRVTYDYGKYGGR